MMQEKRFTSTTRQLANTFNVHSMEERGTNPLIFKFENVITIVRPKRYTDAFVHAVD
jgi:hypothetical protein